MGGSFVEGRLQVDIVADAGGQVPRRHLPQGRWASAAGIQGESAAPGEGAA
jgi:hypothetical protein